MRYKLLLLDFLEAFKWKLNIIEVNAENLPANVFSDATRFRQRAGWPSLENRERSSCLRSEVNHVPWVKKDFQIFFKIFLNYTEAPDLLFKKHAPRLTKRFFRNIKKYL